MLFFIALLYYGIIIVYCTYIYILKYRILAFLYISIIHPMAVLALDRKTGNNVFLD